MDQNASIATLSLLVGFLCVTTIVVTKTSIGIPGPTGPQGNVGPQGILGPQGYQGYQGIQGIQGPQANIGPQGIQGIQGPQGYQGFQGFQGNQGPQGDQGDQGPQGAQGDQGPQGPQGPQGITGDQGNQGPITLAQTILVLSQDTGYSAGPSDEAQGPWPIAGFVTFNQVILYDVTILSTGAGPTYTNITCSKTAAFQFKMQYRSVTVPRSGNTGYGFGIRNVTDNTLTGYLFSSDIDGTETTVTLETGKQYRLEGAFNTSVGVTYPASPLIANNGLLLTISIV